MNIICLEDNEEDYALCKKIIHRTMPEAQIENFRYLNDFLKTTHPYDIIITDLSLPDSYGPEVILKIRKITGKPIIVLSGVGGNHVPDNIVRVIKNAGATIYLSKHQNGFKHLPKIIQQLI